MQVAPNFKINGKSVRWNARYHEINLEDLSWKVVYITDQFPKPNHKYILYYRTSANFITNNASKRIQEIKNLVNELCVSLNEDYEKINFQNKETISVFLEDKKKLYLHLIEKLFILSNKIKSREEN